VVLRKSNLPARTQGPGVVAGTVLSSSKGRDSREDQFFSHMFWFHLLTVACLLGGFDLHSNLLSSKPLVAVLNQSMFGERLVIEAVRRLLWLCLQNMLLSSHFLVLHFFTQIWTCLTDEAYYLLFSYFVQI